MELFEYVKFRWKALSALFVVGLIAILAIGSGSTGEGYIGQAKLLVRPPSDQVGAYAADIDRYVETEMALMTTASYLRAEVGKTGVTPKDLRRSLTWTQVPGSEQVTLQVTRQDPDQAVALVNTAARKYVEASARRNSEAVDQKAATIQKQIKQAQKQLNQSNATVQRATTDFLNQNPDRGTPTPASIAPQAAATQALATNRLQFLYQQQSDLDLTSADSTSRSRVLDRSEVAFTPTGWGLTTYVAALVGLVLVLLAVAGVGLALTRRVLSQERWSAATPGGRVGHAVPLKRTTASRRRHSVRRVREALETVEVPGSQTTVAYLPAKTAATEQKSAFLLESLAEDGIEITEVDSVTELATTLNPHGAGERPHVRVLLLIDRTGATLDDAATVSGFPGHARESIVPVLV